MPRKSLLLLFVNLLILAAAPPGRAASVAIQNFGFEDPVLADGNYTTLQPIPGWTLLDPSNLIVSGSDWGVANQPVAALPSEASEGANVGYIYLTGTVGSGEVALSQVLTATLTANTFYTLQVDIGDPLAYDIFPMTGFPGYRVELRAGGVVLASDSNSLTLTEGTFGTSTVTFYAPVGHAQLGSALEIRLVNLLGDAGLEVDFDNVRLDASLVQIRKTMIALNDVAQSEGVDELLRIPDPATGVAQLVGSLTNGFIESEALAVWPASRPIGKFDQENTAAPVLNDRIFVVDNARLVELDPVTGAGTEIGPIGFSDVDGIAFHPFTRELYGVTYGSNKLIHIDINTGQGTLVASDVLVGHRLEDLAFHPDGRLFVLTSGPRIYQIDIATGAKLSKWVLDGATSLESLLWSPEGAILFSAADRNGGKDLVTIALSPTLETGTVSFVGSPSGFGDIEGLAWLDEDVASVLFTAPTPTDVAPGSHLAFDLAQNVPNPFNPSTRIHFELSQAGNVLLNVYDVKGRLVTSLLQGYRDAGPHSILWNGGSANGMPVAAGVYRYTLTVDGVTQSRQMVLIK